MSGAPLWEEARACGACGSPAWRAAGAVCGKRLVACGGCGVVRLYDRVAEDRVGLLYAHYYPSRAPAAEELAAALANPTFVHRRERLEAVVPAEERRIFEVGCGDGNFLASLRRAGWAVAGSEYDAETVALVRARHGIPLFAGDVAERRPDGAPYPVVAAYHVLEHVYHPADWLRAVRGMTETGGWLHLQVPNYASVTRRLSGHAWASMMFPQHVYFYTPRTLGELLRRHGFAPLSVTTWDPWHGPGTVSASVANQARRALTGRLPWPDRVGEETARADAQSEVAPRVRGARRILEWAANPLARMEAAVGRGAVVDVIARAE